MIPQNTSRKKARIRIKGGISVSVPDNLHLLTHYVLLEQEDWFEDEIKFMRLLLKPGMNVIDVGANYGVYALTAAKIIGANGKLWAFEPSSATAAFLKESMELNHADNLTLMQAGLSDRGGQAKMMLHENAEENFVSQDISESGDHEAIELLTLDECAARFDWSNIDFIKMDAEGHESNIIRGGKAFLKAHSPLIMFEIKAGEKLNVELVEEFATLGYSSYKLIPGMNVLVPFDKNKKIDAYQLNLFCCKPDRAETLRQAGFLVREPCQDVKYAGQGSDWIKYLRKFPYAAQLLPHWHGWCEVNRTAGGWGAYQEALNCYAASRKADITVTERFGYLERSYQLLSGLIEAQPSFSRLVSFVRIASEVGERMVAVNILKFVLKGIKPDTSDIAEPFLPVSPGYDVIDPGENMGNWIAAAIIEQWEKLHAFSSYFTGTASLSMLETLKKSGLQSAEMERRRQLIRMRAGLQRAPEPNQLLSREMPDNLN